MRDMSFMSLRRGVGSTAVWLTDGLTDWTDWPGDPARQQPFHCNGGSSNNQYQPLYILVMGLIVHPRYIFAQTSIFWGQKNSVFVRISVVCSMRLYAMYALYALYAHIGRFVSAFGGRLLNWGISQYHPLHHPFSVVAQYFREHLLIGEGIGHRIY